MDVLVNYWRKKNLIEKYIEDITKNMWKYDICKILVKRLMHIRFSRNDRRVSLKDNDIKQYSVTEQTQIVKCGREFLQ